MGDRLRAGIPSRYVRNRLGQLSLASLRVAYSSTSFGWGKGGDVTSAGWQVTLFDPMWQPCELLYTCYLLTYLLIVPVSLALTHVPNKAASNRFLCSSCKTFLCCNKVFPMAIILCFQHLARRFYFVTITPPRVNWLNYQIPEAVPW